MSLCDDLETKLCQAEVDSEKLTDAAVEHMLRTITEASNFNGLPTAANV